MVSCLFALTFLTAADPTEFVVESVRDERLRARVVSIDADGATMVDGKTIPPGELVAVRRPGVPPLRPNNRPHVRLGNGDSLPGTLVGIENDQVRFRTNLGHDVTLAIPFSAVSEVWLRPRAGTSFAETQVDSDKPRRQDIVRLINGDAIPGTVLAAMEASVRVEVGKDTSNIALDRIGSIAFSTELARPFQVKGPFARLILQNGARITMSKYRIDGETVFGVTNFGQNLRIALAELAVLSVGAGPAQFLSDLKPVRYESKPFLGLSWPLASDRSVVRGELRIGGGTFDKGLGLHSACRLSYAIPPRAVRFATTMGLDDLTGRHGDVVVSFLADGRTVPNGAFQISGGHDAREVAIPLPAGARELTIEIEFGRGGDVEDHVNLGDARFVVAP